MSPKSRKINIQDNHAEKPEAEPNTLSQAWFEEDGWVFVEHPGQRIACFRRSEMEGSFFSAPNAIRHNYPSA